MNSNDAKVIQTFKNSENGGELLLALGLQWGRLMWVRKSHDGFGVLASGRGILMRYYIVLMDLAQGIVFLLFPNFLITFEDPYLGFVECGGFSLFFLGFCAFGDFGTYLI